MRIIVAMASCLVCLLFAPAYADISPRYTKSALRVEIAQNNVDAVERLMDDIQKEFRAGDLEADDIRRMNEVFKVTDPKIHDFIDLWLEEHPGSPYAHAARAWMIRGNEYVSETIPEALDQFRSLMTLSANHAKQAYEIDPFLVPTSDALFGLFNVANIGINFETLINDVLNNTPNFGSLYTALHFTNPGWGGTSKQAVFICETYADQMIGAKPDAVEYCIVKVAGMFYWHNLKERALITLAKPNTENLDYTRIWAAIYNSYDEPGIMDIMQDYFDRETTRDYDLAVSFDNKYYELPLSKQATPRVLPRAHAHALEEIDFDPYNRDLIEILQVSKTTDRQEGDRIYAKDLPNALSQSQIRVLAHRALLSRPFDPALWYGIALHADFLPDPTIFFGADPYFINSIYYSEHDPVYVTEYLMRNFSEMDSFSQILERGIQDGWPEFIETVDYDKEMNCPYIRLFRLREPICQKKTNCGWLYDPGRSVTAVSTIGGGHTKPRHLRIRTYRECV